MNKGYKELYLFSLRLGFSALLRGKINKESIKRIIYPLDIARYYELPVVLKHLKLKDNNLILDISSPKLLAFYIASNYPKVKVFALDKFKEEIKIWKNTFTIPSNLYLLIGDARNLKFEKNKFDEIYSVSVIEHLGNGKDDGDKVMMEEAARVLTKGGKLLLTTIISSKAQTLYKKYNIYSGKHKRIKNTFFCRIYDKNLLTERLFSNDKFKLKKIEICNYKMPYYEKINNNLMPLTLLLGCINYFVAPKMVSTTSNLQSINKRAEFFGEFIKK